jgi:hypothetical protein
MGAATGALQATLTIRHRLPAEGTAGTGGEYAIGRVAVAGSISGARYIPDSAVTGAATNNKTLDIVNKGTAGSGTQSTASITFGNGTNAAAFAATALTANATSTNRDVVANSVLSVKSTVAGTGMTLPAGLIEVDFKVD